MPNNDALFLLIKSLSRSEKRYFKIFTDTDKRINNYEKLFNAIEVMDEYDESIIREKFKGEKFIKQLHVTKNYLKRLIYKSNRNYHAKENRSVRVRNLLTNAEILFNKELFEHCNAELIKAERLSSEYELFNYLVEIYDWKRKLEQQVNPHNYSAFKDILKMQGEVIEKLENLNDYLHLIVDVSASTLNNKSGKLEKEDMLEDEKNALSMEARVMHYNARYFKNVLNEGGGNDDLKLLLEVFEKDPKWVTAKPGTYISTINNLITFYVFSKDYSQAIELVKKAKDVYKRVRPHSENKSLMKQILRTYNIELEIYRDEHLYSENPTHIENTEIFVEAYKFKMPKDYLISFWFQLANIRFLQKDYKSALKWANDIIQMNFRNVREDIQIQARFLNLLIHLEQNNMFVLRYFVDHTRRFIKKRKIMEAHEKILLGFFSKLGRIPSSEYREEYQKLYLKLFPSGEDPMMSRELLDYVDYDRWLVQKLKL